MPVKQSSWQGTGPLAPRFAQNCSVQSCAVANNTDVLHLGEVGEGGGVGVGVKVWGRLLAVNITENETAKMLNVR